MPRSAPTIDGTPTTYLISWSMIDSNGDLRTDSFRVVAGTYSDVNTEAFIVALAAVINADIYKVNVTAEYTAIPATGNALGGVHVSVDDNIVYLAKSVFGDSVRLFVPAPLASLFIDNTETVDKTNAGLVTLTSAFLAMGGWTGSAEYVSVRYTERREINEKQRL